jgi:hypothetical protein
MARNNVARKKGARVSYYKGSLVFLITYADIYMWARKPVRAFKGKTNQPVPCDDYVSSVVATTLITSATRSILVNP